jgi:hypothetical protein
MSATTFGNRAGVAPLDEEIDPAKVDADARGKPDTGETTGRQDYVDLYGNRLSWGSGDPTNPCGIPGYGGVYTGTFANYRLIRRYPTIAHVRRQVFAPIIGNPYGWQQLKRAPAGAVDYIADVFSPRLVRFIKSHLCLALDYGCLGGELVWEVSEGDYYLEAFKPLAIDTMGIMRVRGTGRLAGLRWGSGDAYLERRKSLLYTYGQAIGGEAGFMWGESRLENVRETSWFDAINAMQQLMWITQKIAGTLCIITSPGGTYVSGTKEDGTKIRKSYRDAAMAAGAAIADPRSSGVVWMPTAALSDNIRADNMELMKYPMVQVEVVDFGSHSDAIAGTLERLKYHDSRMSAGYLRSPQTNQESEHSSKAQSGEHTNTDTLDLEGIDADQWDAINTQAVDTLLEIKYGPQSRGSVFGVPAKMTDENRLTDNKLIDATLADDELRAQALTQIDMDAVFKRRGAPGETIIKLETVEPDPNGDAAGPTGTDDAAVDEGDKGNGSTNGGGNGEDNAK